MVDHSLMKLGKLPPFRDERVHDFARFVSSELPAPAPISWLGDQTEWGMLKNDQLGDCTIASKLHGLQVVTKNANIEFQPTDAEALTYYEEIDGYDPSDPNSDQGGIISDVLLWIAKNGMQGFELGGYCRVDPQNDLHVNQAICLFGVLDVGLALPLSAQTADVWDLPEGQAFTGDWAPGSWGGHDVSIHAFETNGDLLCITWGEVKRITRRWFKAYCDEAYALLWQAWIENGGKAPSGFDYATLEKDLAIIRG